MESPAPHSHQHGHCDDHSHDHGHEHAAGPDCPHGHGQGHAHGGSHVRAYMAVFISLAVLTVVTVGISLLDFGHIGNAVLAVAVAAVKASLVGLIFMHLKQEVGVIVALSLLPFLLVGVVFGLNAWDAAVLAGY
jgi:caa(3)-type oxidase subunit IV